MNWAKVQTPATLAKPWEHPTTSFLTLMQTCLAQPCLHRLWLPMPWKNLAMCPEMPHKEQGCYQVRPWHSWGVSLESFLSFDARSEVVSLGAEVLPCGSQSCSSASQRILARLVVDLMHQTWIWTCSRGFGSGGFLGTFSTSFPVLCMIAEHEFPKAGGSARLVVVTIISWCV